MRDANSPRLRRRVFLLCWVGYTVSYLLRTNLSAALDKLIEDMHISRAMAGGIGSLYFWMYAVGQLVNGYLAERLNPKGMVAGGLLLSVAINCLMGVARSYPLLLALWGLNGYSLSMVWPATFKILTNWYSPDAYRKLSVWISLPTTFGYLISWSLIRAVVSRMSWPFAFFLPAAAGVLFLCVWLAFLKPTRESAGLKKPESFEAPEAAGSRRSISRLLIEFGLVYVGLAAIVQGLIKESVNLWGPTLMADLAGPALADMSMAFSIGIPVAGTLGILMIGQLIRWCNNSGKRTLLALFGAVAASAALVCALKTELIASALLLSLMMACVSGANAVITVFLPTGFVRHGISAQVSGMFNFMVYLGAGVGGGLSGMVSDRWGWSGMYLLWAALSMLACCTVVLWQLWLIRKRRARQASG